MEENVRVDISACMAYFKYLSHAPIEIVLVQNFKMSFQPGVSNSVFLNKSISKAILRKEDAGIMEILSNVNRIRYYKCIYSINSIIEQAILSKLENPNILGVEFKNLENIDGKLISTFKVFR